MNTPLQEPAIPEHLRRPLAALWISLGLHGAVLALVQIAPQQSGVELVRGSVIEARLEPVARPVHTPALSPVAGQPTPTVPASQAERTPRKASGTELQTKRQPAEPARPVAASPGLAIPLAVDLKYYSARELDTQPRALIPIVPAYPVAAERAQQSGTVRLILKIEESGAVSSVELLDANPPGVFDDKALAAFRSARLAPAIKDGQPVRARIVIEVRFDYNGGLVTPDAQREINRQ
jgi:protein TonB